MKMFIAIVTAAAVLGAALILMAQWAVEHERVEASQQNIWKITSTMTGPGGSVYGWAVKNIPTGRCFIIAYGGGIVETNPYICGEGTASNESFSSPLLTARSTLR